MAGEQPAHDALGACEPKGSDAHSSGWWPKLLKSPNELDQTPGKLGWPSWTDNACYSIPVVGEPVFCSLSLGREAPSSTPPPPHPSKACSSASKTEMHRQHRLVAQRKCTFPSLWEMCAGLGFWTHTVVEGTLGHCFENPFFISKAFNPVSH